MESFICCSQVPASNRTPCGSSSFTALLSPCYSEEQGRLNCIMSIYLKRQSWLFFVEQSGSNCWFYLSKDLGTEWRLVSHWSRGYCACELTRTSEWMSKRERLLSRKVTVMWGSAVLYLQVQLDYLASENPTGLFSDKTDDLRPRYFTEILSLSYCQNLDKNAYNNNNKEERSSAEMRANTILKRRLSSCKFIILKNRMPVWFE